MSLAAWTPAVLSQELPDISALVQTVKQNQQAVMVNLQKYTFRKYEEAHYGTAGWDRQFDVFYENGHQIERMTEVNGRPLDDKKLQKEDAQVAKEVEKAQKSPAQSILPKGAWDIGTILGNMKYSNPRGDQFRNRPVILLDYTCKDAPKSAGTVAHLYGEIWIDEQDKQVAKLEAHLQEGREPDSSRDPITTFEQDKVPDGTWLPTSNTQSGAQHMLGQAVGSTSRRTVSSDYQLKK